MYAKTLDQYCQLDILSSDDALKSKLKWVMDKTKVAGGTVQM